MFASRKARGLARLALLASAALPAQARAADDGPGDEGAPPIVVTATRDDNGTASEAGVDAERGNEAEAPACERCRFHRGDAVSASSPTSATWR